MARAGAVHVRLRAIVGRRDLVGGVRAAAMTVRWSSGSAPATRFATAAPTARCAPAAARNAEVSGKQHYAAITDPKEVGPLLRLLDGYAGTLPVRCALRLAPLVFVRTGELIKAE